MLFRFFIVVGVMVFLFVCVSLLLVYDYSVFKVVNLVLVIILFFINNILEVIVFYSVMI